MTRIIKNCAVTFVLALTITSHVSAKTPEHIFEEVSASIVIVDVLDAKGEKTGHGSGVVVATGTVVTNCHVSDKVTFLQVRWKDTVYSATLEYHHPYHDLCIVRAPDLDAPHVSLSATQDLKIGSRVFAIGAPRGVELTMSDGIVSGLRNVDASVLIQTNAAMSPGSNGGGLFNEDGRLVGITTWLNFALSADLIPGLLAKVEIARSRGEAEERLKSERRQAENRKLAEKRKALDDARRRLEIEKLEQNEATRVTEEEYRLDAERRQVEVEILRIQEEKRTKQEQEEKKRVAEERRKQDEERASKQRAANEGSERERQQSEAAKRLMEEFIVKIKFKIEQNTSAPEGMSGSPRAEFTIVLLPTGEVLSVKLVKSSGNPAYDDAVERGIFKSAPLPVPPNNPELFREFRELRLPFTYVRR